MKQTPKVLFKDIDEEAEQNIKTFGFHIWYLTEKDLKTVNCFTVGLDKNFNHNNLQITMPLPQKTCANILHALVDHIRNGEEITVNSIHNGLLNFSFLALHVDASKQTMDLPVTRIIIPDKNGKFAHEESCDPHFKIQLD